MIFLLGIDDTDALGHKPGTGRLVRELGYQLRDRSFARLAGVVRHQLLVDPRVPYTSHNSPACAILDVDDDAAAAAVLLEATAYVRAHAANGSDPGVCLVAKNSVPAGVVSFGLRAAAEVVAKEDALRVARRHGLHLEELGGSGDGVIGALAAVGLTAQGNAGRFLEYGGNLRDLPDVVAAASLLERGIALVCAGRDGEPVPPEAQIRTNDWLRPRLIGGRPVLLVQRGEDGWRCLDQKQRHEEAGGDEG
jgi:hypothetical protein